MTIVQLLAAARGPVCVVDIEHHIPLSQSTVSYHLKALVEAGILEMEKRGRWSYYQVVPDRLAALGSSLGHLASEALLPGLSLGESEGGHLRVGEHGVGHQPVSAADLLPLEEVP
ncbi:MAG: ArsR/SmtB family transcription factor [Acidimicrobiia bacterium]